LDEAGKKLQAGLEMALQDGAMLQEEAEKNKDKPPLQVFAEQEALYRLNGSYLQKFTEEMLGEDPSEEALEYLKCIAKDKLTDYLLYDEEALNYDSIDDILCGAVHDAAEHFPPKDEEEEMEE
jgi:hypothetical protein